MAGLGVPRDLGSVPSCGAAAVAGTPAAPGRGSPARALYLPWQRLSSISRSSGSSVDPSSRSSTSSLERVAGGWDSGVAPAAALAALLLVALFGRGSCSPRSPARLPLGRCALGRGVFRDRCRRRCSLHGMSLTRGAEVNDAVDLRAQAAGTYVGLGAVAVTLLAALLLRRGELSAYRSPAAVAGALLVLGLLIAFLLPWMRFDGFEYTGITGPAAQVAAVFASACRRPGRRPSVWLALLTALFTAAAFSTTTFPYGRAYGAWIGVGFALGLVVLADRRSSAAGRPRRALVSARPWSFLPAAGGQLLPPVAGVLLPGRVGTASRDAAFR